MRIFKCKNNNIFLALSESGDKTECAGERLEELIPNTVDAAKEKHVPVISRDGNIITVNVGSVAHPMAEEHHIAFIAVEQGGKIQVANLDKTGKPEAKFNVCDGDFTVYEYCNLHGLWKS